MSFGVKPWREEAPPEGRDPYHDGHRHDRAPQPRSLRSGGRPPALTSPPTATASLPWPLRVSFNFKSRGAPHVAATTTPGTSAWRHLIGRDRPQAAMGRPLAASDRMNQHLMADGDDAGSVGQIRTQREHGPLANHVQGFPSKVMILRALPVVSQHVGVGGFHFVARGPGVALVREPLAQVEIDLYRDVKGVGDEIRRLQSPRHWGTQNPVDGTARFQARGGVTRLLLSRSCEWREVVSGTPPLRAFDLTPIGLAMTDQVNGHRTILRTPG